MRRWTGADWLRAADAWVTGRLADGGIALTGEPVTYKVRFWAVVRCYPTDCGPFWFKENNPGQAFEAALVAAMAEELPQHVVAPFAVDPDRGWLLTADQGATLDRQAGDPLPRWRRLVIEYAALQRDSASAGDALLAGGLTSLAPDRLSGAVHRVADWFAALGTEHPLWPEPAVLDNLRRAGDRLADRPAGVVPMTLDQNDLHVHNVFSSGPAAPYRFFDFGDAVWGHPFATLECVRAALVNEDHAGDAAWRDDDPRLDELTEAYLNEWTGFAPPAVLRRELSAARALHAVHRLVSWHRLLVHADDLECAVWASSPRYWLAEVIRRLAP